MLFGGKPGKYLIRTALDNRGKYLVRTLRITEENIGSCYSDNRGKYLVRTVRITEGNM